MAIYNEGASPCIRDIAAVASDGTDSSYAIFSSGALSSPTIMRVVALAFRGAASYGVYNDGASPDISESTAVGIDADNNYGMYNQSAFPSPSNVTVRTVVGNVYAIFNTSVAGSYRVTVDQSRLTGSTSTVRNNAAFTTLIGASKLDGGAVDAGGGTVKCAAVCDGNYDFVAGPSCP